MTLPVLEFTAVHKRYQLGRQRINLRAALPGRAGRVSHSDAFTALKDVSLALHEGEYVGIIGRNGAGKSTLLKLAARVIAPTIGKVCLRGRVASLIELGVGFHPDLTGTENLQFASAVMGIGRRSIQRRFDEIVDFAGLQSFMSTPVKRYSSGMLARLGFALASHVDAEILAIDEVLAVGDADFQRRSFERMRELRRGGAGILLVSHNLTMIQTLCTRAIRLEHGAVVDAGPPEEVVQRYLSAPAARALSPRDGAAAAVDSLLVTPSHIEPHGPVEITARLSVAELPSNCRVGVAIATIDGLVCAAVDLPGATFDPPGAWDLQIHISDVPLVPGPYRVWLSLVEELDSPIVHAQVAQEFHVDGAERVVSSYGVLALESVVSVRRVP